MTLGAALYMGTCSGHGKGAGGTAHPGHCGGTLGGCPHPPMRGDMGKKTVMVGDPVIIWPPTSQTPKGPTVTNVVINGKIPIVNGDELTPHPTCTVLTTTSTGYKCFFTTSTPAWWLTDIAGSRETAAGHARKLYATSKTVKVNGKFLGRFSDPFGTKSGSGPYSCLSTVSGSSKNVFVGA